MMEYSQVQVQPLVTSERNRIKSNINILVVAFGALQIMLFIVFFIITIEITKHHDYPGTDISAFEKNFTTQLQEINFDNALMTKKGATLIETVYDIQDISDKLDTLIRFMGWYRASNNFYYKVFKLKVNYFTAKNKCKSFGGLLASTGLRNNQVRNEIITKLVKPTNIDTWIGIDDLDIEGKWVWSDGVLSNKSNTIWRPGQPDDFRGKEECGHLDNTFQWTVNDNLCSSLHYFLCEAKLMKKNM